jgi:hypothetical protein
MYDYAVKVWSAEDYLKSEPSTRACITPAKEEKPAVKAKKSAVKKVTPASSEVWRIVRCVVCEVCVW